jgi:hypothetical protein
MSTPQYFFSFFPQFNPDPINDKAWGAGFTDWDLIRALPETQRSSFIPERGYYDPSSPEYLRTLADDLRALPLSNAGVMVYHYHFDGVSALGGFERQLLAQPDVEIPFFLCWANETWTKRWIGQPGDVLVEQTHRLVREMIAEHVAYLARFFCLPHYHCVGGRPLFIIYNAQASKSLPEVISMYRDEFAKLGHNPLIGACISYPQSPAQLQPYDFGCEFQPRFFFNHKVSSLLSNLLVPAKAKFPKIFEWIGSQRQRLLVKDGSRQFRYGDYIDAISSGRIESSLRASTGTFPLMRSSFLSWNNVPRYRLNRTEVTHDGISEESLEVLRKINSDAGLPVLINSWNEWSEGAAIELGQCNNLFRHSFLQVLSRAS